MLRCLNFLKQNPKLAEDVDRTRKTALHWACELDLGSLAEVLVDFGADIYAKDDYGRKPMDEAQAVAQQKGGVHNRDIYDIYRKADHGILMRRTEKYD